jgi:hypothetical protein
MTLLRGFAANLVIPEKEPRTEDAKMPNKYQHPTLSPG